MDTELISLGEIYKNNFSLKVKPVSFGQLTGMTLSYSDKVAVGMYDWKETINKPIYTTGASPCSIIYIKCLANNLVISGHFLRNSPSNYKNDEEFFMAFPPDDNTIKMSKESKDNYDKYTDMMKRVKELTQRYGSNNVEAYLFGQHFDDIKENDPESVKNTQDMARDRFNIDIDLISSGISSDKIADYRSNIIKRDVGDSAMYVPEDNTIYILRE